MKSDDRWAGATPSPRPWSTLSTWCVTWGLLGGVALVAVGHSREGLAQDQVPPATVSPEFAGVSPGNDPLERIYRQGAVLSLFQKRSQEALQRLLAGDFDSALQIVRHLETLCSLGLVAGHPRIAVARDQVVVFQSLAELPDSARQLVLQGMQYEQGVLAAAKRGDLPRARELAGKALDRYTGSLGRTHWMSLQFRRVLASLELAAGRPESARLQLEELLTDAIPQYGPDHAEVAVVHCLLGSLQARLGQAAAAEESLRRGVEILEPIVAADPASTGYAKFWLDSQRLWACLLNDRQAAAEALALVQRTLRLLLAVPIDAKAETLALEIEAARSLSRLRETASADLLFMALERQIVDLIHSGVPLEPVFQDLFVRAWVANLEHQQDLGRAERANGLRRGLENNLRRPIPSIRNGRQEFSTPPNVLEHDPDVTQVSQRLTRRIVLDRMMQLRSRSDLELLASGEFARLVEETDDNLGVATALLGEDDRRVAILTRALASYQQLAQASPDVQQVAMQGFRLLAFSGENAGAGPAAQTLGRMREVLECLETALSRDDSLVQSLRSDLAHAELMLGDVRGAREHIASLGADMQRLAGNSVNAGVAEIREGQIEHRSGEPALAERHLLRGLELLEPVIRAEGDARMISDFAFAHSLLAQVQLEQGDPVAALARAEGILPLLNLFSGNTINRLGNEVVIASALSRLGRVEEADRAFALAGYAAVIQSLAKQCPRAMVEHVFRSHATHLNATGRDVEAAALLGSLKSGGSPREPGGTAGRSPIRDSRVRPAGALQR